MRKYIQDISIVVLGRTILVGVLMYFGFTSDYVYEKLGLLSEIPDWWLGEWYGLRLWLVVLGLLILVAPPIIQFLFDRRGRAIKVGAGKIYQDEDSLTFKQVAELWNKFASPKDGFSEPEIMQKFISDIWLGKFEGWFKPHIWLQTSESVTIHGEHDIHHGISKTPINRSLLVRHMVAYAQPFLEAFFEGSEYQDMAAGKGKKESWKRLSKEPYTAYDHQYGQSGDSLYRTTYIEPLIIKKKDFIRWLQGNNMTLPENWYAKD